MIMILSTNIVTSNERTKAMLKNTASSVAYEIIEKMDNYSDIMLGAFS